MEVNVENLDSSNSIYLKPSIVAPILSTIHLLLDPWHEHTHVHLIAIAGMDIKSQTAGQKCNRKKEDKSEATNCNKN
jgi:hypothetical protein